MTKAFSKNEQLLDLAKKTSDNATVKADLEKWLNDTTVHKDEILRSAREYIDQCPNVERLSQSSAKTSKKVKPKNASSSEGSKSSSQRHRELLIAQHKREEIERQNEAALRLAKQKQELELEQLQEENRNDWQKLTLWSWNCKMTFQKVTRICRKLCHDWVVQSRPTRIKG